MLADVTRVNPLEGQPSIEVFSPAGALESLVMSDRGRGILLTLNSVKFIKARTRRNINPFFLDWVQTNISRRIPRSSPLGVFGLDMFHQNISGEWEHVIARNGYRRILQNHRQ